MIMSIHTAVINDTHSQLTETEYLLQYNEQTNDIKINFALCLRYYTLHHPVGNP